MKPPYPPEDFTPAELQELREVHASMRWLGEIPFRTVLHDTGMRICLVNTMHARRLVQARRRSRTVDESATFELQP